MIRFETFDRVTLRGRRHFFRIVACGNNEIISQSQAYKTYAARDHAVRQIRYNAAEAEVRVGRRA